MLTVSSGTHSDQTAVRFLDEATDEFDSQYDAYKWTNPGRTPNLFTVSDENYAINAMHTSFEEKNVTLHFKSSFSGSYTLSAEEIGDFDSTWSITLVDKQTNTELDLRTESDYVFESLEGEAEDRFELQFKITEVAVVTSNEDTRALTDGIIYSYGENILIQMENESGTVYVADMLGHELLNAEIFSASGSAWSFNPGKEGMYIVNLIRNNKHYSKKVYVRSTMVL